MPSASRNVAPLLASTLLFAGAYADDITVMTSGALTVAYLELNPQ